MKAISEAIKLLIEYNSSIEYDSVRNGERKRKILLTIKRLKKDESNCNKTHRKSRQSI